MRGVVVLAVGIVALAATADADGRASSCAAEGSRTVASNDVARVYEERGERLLACSKANGRRQEIADYSYDVVRELKLRGHHVAYYLESCEIVDPAVCGRGVHAFDVRGPAGAGFFASGEVVRVVLRANGSIAWGAEGEGVGVVFRHTRRGTTRLDRGRRVDPGSLRLRGRKLSWRNGSRVRRATLR